MEKIVYPPQSREANALQCVAALWCANCNPSTSTITPHVVCPPTRHRRCVPRTWTTRACSSHGYQHRSLSTPHNATRWPVWTAAELLLNHPRRGLHHQATRWEGSRAPCHWNVPLNIFQGGWRKALSNRYPTNAKTTTTHTQNQNHKKHPKQV